MSQSRVEGNDEKVAFSDGEDSDGSIPAGQSKLMSQLDDGLDEAESDVETSQSNHSDDDDEIDESKDGSESDSESEISSVGEDDEIEAPGDAHANLLGVLSGRFPSQEEVSPAASYASSSSALPNLRAFVESEAELSGSEASDDEQLGASADEYEEEYNSEEEALPTGEALAKQLKKVHQKVALADDNADIRTFKEMLLGDADYEEGMNSDGFFRTRRYKPSLDETSQMDLFSPNADDSGSDGNEDTQQEASRRRQRHERNAYLHEKRLKEDDDHLLLQDDDSQSIFGVLDNSNSAQHVSHTAKKPPRLAKCGSFLNRSKATLKRLESQTSTALNLQGSTRGFVFKRTTSMNENSNPAAPVTRKPSVTKPAPLVRKASSVDCAPAAKKRSIFRDLVQTS